ncbi:MAG: SusC/RagA family TonB-linked outer membrane protein, partial [Chitinophagaceae bacterium]
MKKRLLLPLIFTVLFFTDGYSQNVITGLVQSKDSLPVAGATVALGNSKVKTSTNNNGRFQLSFPGERAVLEISSVGYTSRSVTVAKNETDVIITLLPKDSQLSEVVVIGYGTRQKGELTGAVSKIDSKTFESRPITNTQNALQGALAGVTVTRGSGQPGRENYALQIRGTSSINGSKVLVLIDGIPGDLNELNPNDIADLTVLKDASASIYGARAADGVVLVTTKKGKKGNPSLSYSTNFARKTPQFLKTMANTLHMAEMYDEGMKNIGQPGVSQAVFDKIKANAEPDVASGWIKYLEAFPGFYQSHNWNDDVYGKGNQQMHNLTMSGGGDNNNYLFSAGYEKNEGTFKVGVNKSDRYNLRLNYDFKFFDRLSIETRTSFVTEQILEPGGLSTALYMATKIGSYVPVYNPQGQYYKYQGGFRNPLQYLDAQTGTSKSNSSSFATNIKATLEIIDNLKLVAQFGATLSNRDGSVTRPTFNEYNWNGSIFGRVNVPNTASYSNSKNLYKNATAYLDYTKTLFTRSQISITAGASHEENDLQGQSITGYNFLSNELFTLNLADRTKPEYANFSGNISDWALQSYFGRISYAYDKKYIIDVTARTDGSSKFAKTKRWSSVFPAVLVAWNLSQEKFLQGVDFLSQLKLRASWGKSGN